MGNIVRQRLGDLLVEPIETLDVEIKNWLNPTNNGDRARIARALIALANHGGGYLVIGYDRQSDGSYTASVPRPDDIEGYNTDSINGIVSRFAEPPFHCEAEFVVDPVSGLIHPVVRVPGGHAIPIRAKRDGPAGEIAKDTYYIRRPGPSSEAPQSAYEWDELIRRCVQQQRETLLDGIRGILTSGPVEALPPDDSTRLAAWSEESRGKWKEVTRHLDADNPARFPNGHYEVSYFVLGEMDTLSLPELKRVLDASVVRYSGWPPFWVPTKTGLTPYADDGVLECWIDPEHSFSPDVARSDFWRAAPNGSMFLIRGYQEDGRDGAGVSPGTRLDVALPIYRMGECLLQAASLAENLAGRDAEVLFHARYTGLAGRSLISLSGQRAIYSERVTRVDSFVGGTRGSVSRIRDNLPELLLELLSPLYALFGLFELDTSLVNSVVNEMKGYAK